MKTSLLRNPITNIAAVVAAIGMTLSTPFATTSDASIYVKIPGVGGESTDAGHERWIDVLSYSWGASSPETGQGRSQGGVVVKDLRLTMEYEKAAPQLQRSCLVGDVIPELTIEQTANYGGRNVYLVWELKNVHVTGFQVSGKLGGQEGEERRPEIDVTLNFQEIKVTYTELDEEGEPQGDVGFEWNVQEGGQ